MYAREVMIETRRLRLRPMESGDLDELVALHTDPEVTRFIRPLDRAAAQERLRVNEDEWMQRGRTRLHRLGIAQFELPYLTAMISPARSESPSAST